MKTYRVTWEIDVDARTPLGAAIEALKIQRDPKSLAVVFDVRKPDGSHSTFDLATAAQRQEIAGL